MFEINGIQYIRVKPERVSDAGIPDCKGCAFSGSEFSCPDDHEIECTKGQTKDWIIWKEVTEDENRTD